MRKNVLAILRQMGRLTAVCSAVARGATSGAPARRANLVIGSIDADQAFALVVVAAQPMDPYLETTRAGL